MDLEIRNLSNELVELLNKHEIIPMEVKRLVLVEILERVSKEANNILLKQQSTMLSRGNDDELHKDSME